MKSKGHHILNFLSFIVWPLFFITACPVYAVTIIDSNVPGVAGTKHNLSIYGPGKTAALTGTVSVTNASPVVTGSGTIFNAELTAGDKILIVGVPYAVLYIASNTSLTLTANYQGATAAGLEITGGGVKATIPAAGGRLPGTTEICVFCHTPHNANPSGPIWNKQDSGATYTVYERLGTVLAQMGQPDGASKACLSCHDGTIAIGSLLNAPGAVLQQTIEMKGVRGDAPVGALFSASSANLATDLRDDHPISFVYTDGNSGSYDLNPVEIKNPGVNNANISPARLDRNSKVQCSSCHDPHDPRDGNNNRIPKFMVTPYGVGSLLCTACHNKYGWADPLYPDDLSKGAIHRTSQSEWNGALPNPWHIDMGAPGLQTPNSGDTPRSHGCFSCHKSHHGQTGKMLTQDLIGTNKEENTCLACHNGNVASKDIEGTLGRPYTHPTTTVDDLHYRPDILGPSPMREVGTNYAYIYDQPSNLTYSPDRRHAECVDCHNTHVAKSGNHTVGSSNGGYLYGNVIGNNLLGSSGVKPNVGGINTLTTASFAAIPVTDPNNYMRVFLTEDTSVTPLTDRVEGYLCIKCHSGYAYGTSQPLLSSPAGLYQSDTTEDFDYDNYSYHPVFAQGKNQPDAGANLNWPGNGLGLTNTFQCITDGNCAVGAGGVTHTSTITCSDCHGNSDYGSTPKGPHGSNNKWILRGNETGFGTPVNFCYNCHKRNVYGDEDYAAPTNANYARVSHPVDGINSPFYKNPVLSGQNTGNASNAYGNLCLSCHGGGTKDQNGFTVIDGTHGSNTAAGIGADPLGKRMMNGACVTGHTHATTAGGVQLWFKAAADSVCNYVYPGGTVTGNTANYDYW